ncbi:MULTISPECIES: hypothetical protein [Aphanothece]|uniref:hypothetical protein n=1 Tax=Aphanothece TaxID=1121 RepID=UPI003984AC42
MKTPPPPPPLPPEGTVPGEPADDKPAGQADLVPPPSNQLAKRASPGVRYFRNPQNNHKVYPSNFAIVAGAFFFGPIFFLCIGEVGHALANLLLGLLLWLIFLGWIVWIAYAIAAPSIVRNKWLMRGYVEER